MTHNVAYLSERDRDMGCRIANVVDEDFGNNTELKSILLQFFNR